MPDGSVSSRMRHASHSTTPAPASATNAVIGRTQGPSQVNGTSLFSLPVQGTTAPAPVPAWQRDAGLGSGAPHTLSSASRRFILQGMAIILLLIAAAQEIAQNDPRQTYEFIEKGTLPIEKRTVFGRIVEKREDGYLVEIDAPWESTRRTVTLRDAMLEAGPLLETAAMRDQRVEQGWAERGYTKVTTADGQTAFVVSREVELAERARRAGLDARPPDPDYVPPEALLALELPQPADTPDVESGGGSTFPWARRTGQAALMLAALLLAFVIARNTLFSE